MGQQKEHQQKSAAAIGEVLRQARQRSGLTQAELGEFAGGIDRHFVAGIERGDATKQLQRLLALAELLGLEIVARPVAGRAPQETE